MKTIMILLDTVRKDYLSIYNSRTDVQTPNIDMLGEDSYIFDNHYTGSLPCMPARRDLFTGRLDFLERFWGGMEPFDCVLQKELSINEIPTHIITDHHHYWHHGGEGYLQYFDTFQMVRGQESDSYISHLDNYQEPEKTHGRFNKQYFLNKAKVNSRDEYPTIETFNKAVNFLNDHKDDENFYLQVEGFDPHEPFDSPQEFMDLYNLSESDIEEFYNSPKYGKCIDSEEQLEFITKKYKANLSFADYGIGKVIKALKDLGIYEECNIIFTSDHGFHLGEHQSIGKGVTHVYNEISQIPLIHKKPFQKKQKRINYLTQNIDIMPTLIDMYNIRNTYKFHGKSYLSILNNEEKKYNKREAIISGYHGQSVMISDGEKTFFKAPNNKSNHPLYHYTAMPTMIKGYIGSKYGFFPMNLKNIEIGRFLSHTEFPIFKFPFSSKTVKNPMLGEIFEDELYLNSDFEQKNKVNSESATLEMKLKIIKLMKEYESPKEQYERLGLKKEEL